MQFWGSTAPLKTAPQNAASGDLENTHFRLGKKTPLVHEASPSRVKCTSQDS
jgi:hypothetical protein